MQARQRRANCEATKPRLRDWAIDDSLLSESIEEAFGDLVTVEMQ